MKPLSLSTIPTDYIAVLLEAVKHHGITAGQLLAGSSIKVSSLEDYFHQTALDEFIALVLRAIEVTGEPALGLEFGRSMSLTSHGMLGVAASNQGTVGDALDVLMAYAELRFGFYQIQASSEDGMVTITLSLSSLPELFSRFMVEAFLAFVVAQLGDDVAQARLGIKVTWPSPQAVEPYLKSLGVIPEFSSADNTLCFPGRLLKRKIGKANRALARMALEQCREQLESRARGYASVVTQLLRESRDKMISRDFVAEQLNISGSTLARRLAQEHTDFTSLSRQVRFDQACEYLRQTGKSIQEIADLLGYCDASNFGRLFRQQAGCSPSAYRSRHRQPV